MVVKITVWKNGRILFHMSNNPTQNRWIFFMFFARGWFIPYPIHRIETIKDCEWKDPPIKPQYQKLWDLSIKIWREIPATILEWQNFQKIQRNNDKHEKVWILSHKKDSYINLGLETSTIFITINISSNK